MSSLVLRRITSYQLGKLLLRRPCFFVGTRGLTYSCVVYQQRKEQANSTSDLDVKRENPYAHLTMGQKVARAGADFTYFLVILAGVGIIGVLGYALSSELFSTTGPNAVYSAAFKKCTTNREVLDALGEPVKAFGETSRRGRRQHVQHTEFISPDGEEHTRIKFYMKGQFRTAAVHAEMYKDAQGNKDFEYLIVECEGYPAKTIVLAKREKPPQTETVTFY